MAVPSVITDLNVVAASNSPAGADSVASNTGPDEYFRAISAIVKREQSQGTATASAATVDLGAITTGSYLHITGTTGISAFGTVAAGVERTLVFDGSLTITHNATSLILPGAANIVTAAGDVAVFRSEGSGNWRCTHYERKRGEDLINVKDYGADSTGGTDSTTAIQSAIDAAATRGGGIVFFPAGYYLTSSTLVVSTPNVFLVGEATAKMSSISFNAALGGTAIRFQHGTPTSIILNCGMRFLSLVSSNTTHQKIAVDLVDVSNFSMEDCSVAHSYGTWTGAGSIGLRIRGRDNSYVGRTTIVADQPIHVTTNPNSVSSMDHWHFEDVYLVGQLAAATLPLILVDTGIQLSEVVFDGIQPWIGGTNGFVWNDTTSAILSQQLRFENIRWEQQGATGGYLFNIAHNTGIYGLVFNKNTMGNGAAGVLGYKLRNIHNVTISNVYFNSTDVAIDVDGTVNGIIGANCWWKDSSTATLTGQKSIYSGIKSNPLATLSDSFAYALSTTQTKQEVRDFWAQGASVTVANNGTAIIGDGAGGTYPMQGFLFVNTDNSDTAAIYYIRGQTGTTFEVSDPTASFSNTLGTAGHNIAGSGTNYVIENKSGASTKYRYFLIGSDSLRY